MSQNIMIQVAMSLNIIMITGLSEVAMSLNIIMIQDFLRFNC